jgi:acyl carrier protein
MDPTSIQMRNAFGESSLPPRTNKEEVTMSTRSAVVDQFTKVAGEFDKKLPPLTDDMPLLESGLDSLCFAVIVTRLEDSLGVDPFSAENTLFPVTFGEFVQLYETAAR